MRLPHILFALTMLFLSSSSFAQDFVRELDPKTEKVLLRGKLTFDDILNETTCKWLPDGSAAYQPAQASVDDLNKIAADYRYIVFLGTWCSDTKDLLPKFYKVLIEAGIDLHSVELFGVNRNKQALNIEHTLYSIDRVPTIIVMHQYREIGRIIESVNSSIEEELSEMISKDYALLQQERIKKFKQ